MFWFMMILKHVIKKGFDGRYNFAYISVKNISDIAAYPITVDLVDDAKRFFLSENFFMLMPFEEKEINITCDKGEVEDIKMNEIQLISNF